MYTSTDYSCQTQMFKQLDGEVLVGTDVYKSVNFLTYWNNFIHILTSLRNTRTW